MEFSADLHVHSRFSRATSRELDLPSLDLWAERKGLTVVGTGDLTHPEWLAEIEEQLEPAETGLFRLKPEFFKGGGQTRFILSTEISSIYKKNGRVRKIHSVILMPNLEAARRLSERLGRLGNVKSDGRPILGLDARDLLAISLDIDPESFFIPAHIWTPWFSLFGSKSGFDSLEECFEDLSGHIHALETGLSSDPPMNWRLSALDRYVLVSNSDAHSAEKLGREANLFDCDLSYPAMTAAMKGGPGFAGTIEFFPEEGKYHLDGHRKCNLRLDPEETRDNNGLCPVCGKPVTIGVMNRIMELADRPAGPPPAGAAPFYSLIPLTEILSEVVEAGPKTKRVMTLYHEFLNSLGPELFILRQAPLTDLAEIGGALFAQGVERMRRGEIRAEAGYDGEFGRISLFAPGEKQSLGGQKTLFSLGSPAEKKKKVHPKPAEPKVDPPEIQAEPPVLAMNDPLIDDLNPEQKKAVTHPPAPLSIVAGPGTGKTLVLTRRAAWLIREELVRPDEILGLTFTRQAAGEMAQRLTALLPFRSQARGLAIMTFHALGLRLLNRDGQEPPRILTEEERLEIAKQSVQDFPFKAEELLSRISLAKQNLMLPPDVKDPETARAYGRYEASLAEQNAMDFDDMVVRSVIRLKEDATWAESIRARYTCLLIDEYQDINLAQYAMARLLTGSNHPNLTVIGDPDQAIYGFRGADSSYFQRFGRDYPEAEVVRLSRNYRSSETIVKAAGQVIAHNRDPERKSLTSTLKGPPKLTTAVLKTPKAEAEFVIYQIEKLLGGTSHYILDSGRTDSRNEPAEPGGLSLGDVAVLYRLHTLAGPLAEALDKAGLPFQQSGREPARETDELDFTAEKINLLTMHAAKGLEFPVVIIIGVEEGLLPYEPPKKEPADESEERRLFYVGLTRAKRHLILTGVKTRSLFGRKNTPRPSPFMGEISGELKKKERLPRKKPKPKIRQLSLFG